MQAEVTFTINLRENEFRQIKGLFNVSEQMLSGVLSTICQAATEEYIRMILGQRIYSRASDIREYRLLLLIKYVFNGKVPNESTVSRLFQMTSSQSRTLIRSVISKYQYELADAVKNTLISILESAQIENETDYIFYVTNDSLVEALNAMLAAADGSLPQVKKNKDSVAS